MVHVAPYVGAWIETTSVGLQPVEEQVAPYVGAWIETGNGAAKNSRHSVAPYVGAWIETSPLSHSASSHKSHPMWVRGLKLLYITITTLHISRTLCGCVD